MDHGKVLMVLLWLLIGFFGIIMGEYWDIDGYALWYWLWQFAIEAAAIEIHSGLFSHEEIVFFHSYAHVYRGVLYKIKIPSDLKQSDFLDVNSAVHE